MILILVVGLLLSGNAYADEFRGQASDYLTIGLNKKEFRKIVDGGVSYGNRAVTGGTAVDYNLSKEITELRKPYGWPHIGKVFRYYSYSKYFPEYNTEILSHSGTWDVNKFIGVEGFGIKRAPEKWVYYVFENVTKPMECKNKSKMWIKCKGTLGNGTFKSVVFSKDEAIAVADPKYVIIYKEKQKKRKKEEKKIADKKKKEEQRAEAKASGDLTFTIKDKKEQCEAIGFAPATEKFADCVLRLVELDVKSQQATQIALAQSQGNQQVAEQLKKQNNSRSSDAFIDLGLKLLSPQSTVSAPSTSTCRVIGSGAYKTVNCW